MWQGCVCYVVNERELIVVNVVAGVCLLKLS